MSAERPEAGEVWEVMRGNGLGTLVKIVRVPETTPAETPYVVFRVEGEGRDRRAALDERWGTNVVRRESGKASLTVAQEVARDRLIRLGVGNYGRETPDGAVLKVLADHFVWGQGADISALISRAEEIARGVNGNGD